MQGRIACRDLYYAKYYGQGRGKWPLGNFFLNEDLGGKMQGGKKN